jgi:hypothetical protein
MFGHNDQHHHEESNLPEPDGALVGDHGAVAPQATDDTAGAYIDDVAPASTTTVTPQPADDADDQATDVTAAEPVEDIVATPASVGPTAPAVPVTPANTDALLDIKQQALQQLTPLVGHLEQSPEEKFRTTMMMIQASDNHELVSTAYEAAGQIPDEKVRAQALLDIVNEINYFTHNGAPEA